MNELIEIFRQSKLFGGLSQQQLNELCQGCRFLTIPKGTVIYRANTRFDHLVFLQKGLLQSIEVGAEGKCTEITPIHPNQLIGMTYLFADRVRDEHLFALQQSQIVLIDFQQVTRLWLSNPTSIKALCEHFISIIQILKRDRRSLLRSQTTLRIIGVLRKYLVRDGEGWYLQHLPKQQEIADLANTTRETVSRTLSQLSSAGIIEKRHAKIRILNPEPLELD